MRRSAAIIGGPALVAAISVAVSVAPSAAAPAAGPAVGPAVVAWAFVIAPEPASLRAPDTTTPRRLPGATVARTDAEIADLGRAVDWFPARHPTPPAVVAGAAGRAWACGFCHLPGGEGRVENAALAGLAPGYVAAQVAAFAAGTRAAAVPDYLPTAMMTRIAHQVSPADIAAADAYFSRLRFVSRVHVVEAATVPAMRPHHFILARTPGGGSEALGDRIVETPDDLAAFDLRDPRTTYTAFVPPGSLARGAAVTARVGCAGCHGARMRGWGAGRSPTYIFRQLLAFKTGARHDPAAGPMTAVAARLTPADMIAVAAYWGSLRP